MNEVELLVHGREVTLEQHKAVHARVIWYVPCTQLFAMTVAQTAAGAEPNCSRTVNYDKQFRLTLVQRGFRVWQTECSSRLNHG